MDLIDELLERDAGTVNSTIIGKPLDSFGKESKAMKKKKVMFECQHKIFDNYNSCIHAVDCRIELLIFEMAQETKKLSLTCLFFFISGT